MTRLAVKTYITNLLIDGLAGCDPGVDVLDQKPKSVIIGEHALIVVMLPREDEKRSSLPRQGTTDPTLLGGGKIRRDDVRLDIYWVSEDELSGGRTFDVLLANIDSVFRLVDFSRGPIDITDPVTYEESNIIEIGEEFLTVVADPQLDKTIQGLVLFEAHKAMRVREIGGEGVPIRTPIVGQCGP